MTREHLLTALGLAAVTAAVFAAYAVTLDNDFVYDDPLLILDNPVVTDPSVSFVKAFTMPYFGAGGGGMGYYRPLMTLCFRMEHWLYRGEPFGFHLDNLLIHLGACFMVFFLLIRLNASRTGGFLAALVLAVHPVTTESVAWISGRTDPFAFLFMGLSLLLFLRVLEVRRWPVYITSLLFFLASMLVKEIGVILVFVVSIVANAHSGERRRGGNLLAGGFFAVGVVLAFFILYCIPRDDPATLFQGRGNLWERGLTFLSVVPDYLGKIFYPGDLNLARPVPLVDSLGHLAVWGGAAILGITVAVILFAVWKKKGALALGSSLFFFGLLAVSSVFPISYGLTEMEFPFFERYLYIPLAGFLIALASLLRGKWSKAGAAVLVLALTPFMVHATRERSLQWRDNTTLFMTDLESYPDSHTLWFNAGQAFLEEGKYMEAQSAFHRAHYLEPTLTMAKVHEAVAVAELKRFNEAVGMLKEILRREPENGQAHEALGYVFAGAKRYLDAFMSYAQAAEILEGSPVALGGRNEAARRVKAEMEALFLEQRDFPAVLALANHVLDVIPSCSWALEAKGLSLLEMGRKQEGVKALEGALAVGGEPPLRAMATLVEIYETDGRVDEAEALKQELKRLFGN